VRQSRSPKTVDGVADVATRLLNVNRAERPFYPFAKGARFGLGCGQARRDRPQAAVFPEEMDEVGGRFIGDPARHPLMNWDPARDRVLGDAIDQRSHVISNIRSGCLPTILRTFNDVRCRAAAEAERTSRAVIHAAQIYVSTP